MQEMRIPWEKLQAVTLRKSGHRVVMALIVKFANGDANSLIALDAGLQDP